MFDKSNYKEVIDYYLDNKSIPIDKNASKEVQDRQEKNAINLRQRTKEEGDKLFGDFLSNELLPEDQAKLSFLWNEKFNSIVEPDLTKIPVCFQMSKTFKAGAPLKFSPTQRQADAFMMEKKSGLLAYGVGVGKTLAAIGCFSQAFYNGYANYGIFVVPTNTYDKWIGDIQGYVDKDTNRFMQGALPQLPPLVGLYNLNPAIVKEKLKEYSSHDEAILSSYIVAIEILRKGGDMTDQKRKDLSDILPDLEWAGITAQYKVYTEISSSAKPKSLTGWMADYIRDEYNYQIYTLGKIKEFAKGTIFVTTEVGIQRLGISDSNKSKLSARLFNILSQGEHSDPMREKEIAGLELRIQQTISSSLKNAKINVEDLRIDWCCFDEAHYYKKLFTYVKGQVTSEYEDDKTGQTKYKRDKSKYELKSGQYPSSRALSAFVLSHYIQETNDNRNVVQLTATPFTNSPLEVFSMLTLTNYSQLEEMGLDNMVDFFDTFMRINYDIKYTPQKTVVKDVVLTGYNNLSQLRQIIYSMMDKKDEGANLQRPTKIIMPSVEKGIETTLPMTVDQNELMKTVKSYISGNDEYEAICRGALMEEIENTDYDGLTDDELIFEYERVTGKEFTGERDNLSESRRDDLVKQIKGSKTQGLEMQEGDLTEEESAGVRVLKGLAMMRQITLSPYLYYKACKRSMSAEPEPPDYKDYIQSSPKMLYVMGCIKSVVDFHKDHGEKISGQVIYMNAGIEYFPLIKEYLVKELGFKDTQVGIVSGGMSKNAKENVKRQFLSGDILVLIGSSTISVGVDLQNNSSTLYNCYYDWNPTDAAQIEGRIWRQGNRFAYVRIVYPQCYNSADPVIFEYLNSKTLRINEIWNRSSTVQELDLRDFNPKELQKKLITDPEEKAEWEILEETQHLQNNIIYFENRRDMLNDAMYAFRGVRDNKEEVISILNTLSSKKLQIARKEAIANQKDKIAGIIDKYSGDTAIMTAEIEKYKKTRYDYENDPDGKFVPVDYAIAGDDVIYADARKFIETLDNINYRDDATWGSDVLRKKFDWGRTLSDYRSSYKDMMAANEKVMKPMNINFEAGDSPVAEFDKKLEQYREQLDDIEASKPQRIARIKAEMAANAPNIKTVQERIDEFSAANYTYLPPQLISAAAIAIEEKENIPETTVDNAGMTDYVQVIPPSTPEGQVEKENLIQQAMESVENAPADQAEQQAAEEAQTEELSKEVIQEQIKSLSSALKYADAADQQDLKTQIKDLKIALKYV